MTDTYAYSAFGEVAASTGSTAAPFQYAGESGYYRDNSNGYHVRQRTYQPMIARWLAKDPLGLRPNYVYSDNRPTRLHDPSGLTPFDVELPAGLECSGCAGFAALLEYRTPVPLPNVKVLVIQRLTLSYHIQTCRPNPNCPAQCVVIRTEPSCQLTVWEHLGTISAERDLLGKWLIAGPQDEWYFSTIGPVPPSNFPCELKGRIKFRAKVRGFRYKREWDPYRSDVERAILPSSDPWKLGEDVKCGFSTFTMSMILQNEPAWFTQEYVYESDVELVQDFDCCVNNAALMKSRVRLSYETTGRYKAISINNCLDRPKLRPAAPNM